MVLLLDEKTTQKGEGKNQASHCHVELSIWSDDSDLLILFSFKF
jgi:hypothetical protein